MSLLDTLILSFGTEGLAEVKKEIEETERKIDQLNAKLDQARKETAEKILNELYHREEMGFETIKWYAKEYWGVEIKE